MESAIAVSRLVMGGVFEELPGLRVILAHGGGFFPYQNRPAGSRYAARPELQAACASPQRVSDQHLRRQLDP